MVIVHSLYNEAGRVEIDEGLCKQCGLCAGICPAEVLYLEDGRVRMREDSPFGRIACGHCMMTCPEGSIKVTGRGLSPDDLRSLPPAAERASAEQLEALLRSRRSVRRFKDREVEAEILDRIVRMASSAPMGIPPWGVGVTVVSGKARVQELDGRKVE